MPKVIDEKIRQHMVSLFMDGLSTKEIAKETGYSSAAIGKHIKNLVPEGLYKQRAKESWRKGINKYHKRQSKSYATRPHLTLSKATNSIKDAESPLVIARRTLGDRLEEKSGGFWLRGRPSTLMLVMQAVNRIRKRTGMEQIDVNPSWRV